MDLFNTILKEQAVKRASEPDGDLAAEWPRRLLAMYQKDREQWVATRPRGFGAPPRPAAEDYTRVGERAALQLAIQRFQSPYSQRSPAWPSRSRWAPYVPPPQGVVAAAGAYAGMNEAAIDAGNKTMKKAWKDILKEYYHRNPRGAEDFCTPALGVVGRGRNVCSEILLGVDKYGKRRLVGLDRAGFSIKEIILGSIEEAVDGAPARAPRWGGDATQAGHVKRLASLWEDIHGRPSDLAVHPKALEFHEATGLAESLASLFSQISRKATVKLIEILAEAKAQPERGWIPSVVVPHMTRGAGGLLGGGRRKATRRKATRRKATRRKTRRKSRRKTGRRRR